MKNRFFIMLSSQNGDYIQPIVDDEDDVMLFSSEQEARDVATEHMACQAFGYEIFERGTGL